jgi:hypothetical protein
MTTDVESALADLEEARICATAAKRRKTIESYWPRDMHMPSILTCDSCTIALECEFAFDSYNTSGDCITYY